MKRIILLSFGFIGIFSLAITASKDSSNALMWESPQAYCFACECLGEFSTGDCMVVPAQTQVTCGTGFAGYCQNCSLIVYQKTPGTECPNGGGILQ